MKHAIFSIVASALLLAATPALAKKKEKPVLPEVVLRAQTVFVAILPAAEPLADPMANRKAQEDVEKALMKWARFRLVLEAYSADLVIAVRKGTGKAANPTISGGPTDSRPGTIETTDNQIRIGVQQGRPPGGSQTSDPASPDGRAHTGIEVGTPDDTLKVYLGGEAYSSGSSSIWTYSAKNGLRPPDVTAVAEFRKVIDEAEQAAKKKQQQQPSQPQPNQPKTP